MPWSANPEVHARLTKQILDMVEIRDDSLRFRAALGIIAYEGANSEALQSAFYCSTVAMHALHAADYWPENKIRVATGHL